MPAIHRFEPEARAEYHAAIRHDAAETGQAEVAARFVASVESALAAICTAPGMWRVVEPPDLRRYVLRRFPFVLYYQHRSAENVVVVYAVMRTSRQPGYWHGRPSSP